MSVFYRNPQHAYPVATRGEGVYLYDAQGRQYLDGSGGAAVSCLGHGHPEVIAAIRRQLEQMAFAHTAFFTNAPQEQLAELLAYQFGEPGARTYFLSGGSEANETALKLVRQYWLARGRPRKSLMISRHQSYHGNTLGALSISGNLRRRQIYGPLMHDWPRIEPCYAFRHQANDETEQQYGQRSAEYLEAAIIEAGAENVAAFIAETVVGATLGAVPAVEGYFQKIREICDRYEVLLILDEVMSGRGRTGRWFAFEDEHIRPDIVTVAKGLGAGYIPIGAMICRSHIHDTVIQQVGSFEHGHTYVGHATACAAGLAVAEVIREGNLLGRVLELGKQLQSELNRSLGEHPHVGDIRGRGLFVGIELLADRETKRPPDARLDLAAKIRNAALAQGLLCYPGNGTADGVDGAHILLAPPFICRDQHISELVEKLGLALETIDFD